MKSKIKLIYSNRSISINDKVIRLNRHEFKVVSYLINNNKYYISANQIMQNLDINKDYNKFVFGFMHKLDKKLDGIILFSRIGDSYKIE